MEQENEIENEMDVECGFGTEAVVTQDDELCDLQITVDFTAVMLKGEGKVVIIRDLEAHRDDWADGYADPAPAIVLEAPEVERLVEVLTKMLNEMRR